MRISDWSSDVCSSDLVSFAGDYKGYGKIVIIDHGGGWTSLLTGMIALSVSVGDTLDAGASVGRAGSDDSRIHIELRRAGLSVDVAATSSEEPTSQLQSLMRNSYAVFSLRTNKRPQHQNTYSK